MYLTANSASSSEVARNSLAGWFCFMSFQCSADPPLRPRWTLGRCLLPGGEVFRYRSKIEIRYVLNIANQSFGAIAVIWCIKRTLPPTLPSVPKRRGAVLQVGFVSCHSNVSLTHLCALAGRSDAVSSREEKSLDTDRKSKIATSKTSQINPLMPSRCNGA